jgi:hypothetical protein
MGGGNAIVSHADADPELAFPLLRFRYHLLHHIAVITHFKNPPQKQGGVRGRVAA